MGSAIAERLKINYQIYTFDKDKNKTKNLSGIHVTDNILDLLKKVETVILAVKPQDFDSVLNGINSNVEGKLIISIAAGIPTSYVEKILGKARVVRVMPNLPAKVEKGMSCLCKGRFASDEDLELAEELFKRVGETLAINENMMDAATAVSGSGPGFFFSLAQGKDIKEVQEFGKNVFTPKLAEAAEVVGFDRSQAHTLASTTTAGSIALMVSTNLSAKALCLRVTSKKGTTEAGLQVLNHNIENLIEAVEAAVKRAEELSKRE